jgi:hypothetical protein
VLSFSASAIAFGNGRHSRAIDNSDTWKPRAKPSSRRVKSIRQALREPTAWESMPKRRTGILA